MRDVDKIKDKLDIIELIGEYVDLKKSGRNFKGLCPFHSEKTPSFYVSADRQIWHCFGACDEGGDIVSFYMKIENTTFPEALKELAKKAGVTLTSSFEHDKSWHEKSRLYEINHLTSEYYHYLLTKHSIGKQALSYVRNRGLSDKIIKTFLLGYAPSGWRNLLPFLKKKGYKDEEIERAGLIIKSTNNYYDRFRGRLMFTLKDHRGNIVGFSGRVLDPNEKQAKYINTPETSLYHKSSILYGLDTTQQQVKENDMAIICEGEFDVLSSYQNGISNTVAIKGTALTQDQLRILKRYTPNILLALDMDVAGDKAARRSIELAEELDFNIKVIELTNGKDLDEAIQNDISIVKQEIRSAPSVYDFILRSALKRHDVNDATGKKQIASEVVPLYVKIQNSIVKDFFVKKLAKTLDVSIDAIVEQMTREEKKKKLIGAPIENNHNNGNNKKSRQEKLEEYLLSLLVQTGKTDLYLQKLDKTITIDSLETPAIRRIVLLLLKKKPIPSELSKSYNRAYLKDLGSILKDENVFDKEFVETMVNVQKGILRRKLKEIAIELKSEGENIKLNSEFREVSEKLKELEK